MGKYLLAIDLVSSGSKVDLFTVEGQYVTTATYGTKIHFLENGRAVQIPADWESAIFEPIREITAKVDASEIIGISLSAQSEICVFVDRNGKPLMNALSWADERGFEAKEITGGSLTPERYAYLTAGNCTRNSAFYKSIWVRDNMPELFEKTYRVLNCKDYLTLCLTGEFVTEISDAAQLGCFDYRAGNWSKEIFDAAGMDMEKYPTVARSCDVVGTVTKEAASRCGLIAGTPVVAGGGDCLCSGMGAGCIEAGDIFLQLGSSIWMSMATKEVVEDYERTPVLRNLRHVVTDMNEPQCIVQDFGTNFKWMKNSIFRYDPAFAGDTNVYPYTNIYPYTMIDEHIAESVPGAHGLVYLPHIMGESRIVADEYAKAAFIGLSWEHTRADMIRAVLEGGVYNIKQMMQRYQEIHPVKQLYVVGNGAKESGMVQVLCDILDLPVVRTTVTGTTDSIAAAVLAGVGTGVYKSFGEVSRFWQVDRVFEPNQEYQSIYREGFQRHFEGYDALRGMFKSMYQSKQ